ncbi:MAG: hypothetical protein U1B80_10355, partial [Anaerolineaceae bacterium]|nr:hypothetical protein [Anaerolineaceae bacterium]
MQESFFFLNQFWVAFLFMVPMVLIARSVVAGTRYSPILIIVVFGLIMGALLTATGVSAPGLPEFALLGLLSRATVIVLAVSFFAGGQELRRLFGGVKLPPDTSVILSKEDMFFGTTRWQLFFIVRSFFVLVGLDSTIRLLMGFNTGTAIDV